MTLDDETLRAHAERFLAAWNSHDVEAVVQCYTEDLTYRDPNTRGDVLGAQALRRYLRKLFGAWRMHWILREAFPLRGHDGAAILWRASFRRVEAAQAIETIGMDLVIVRGERVLRNEVHFDRSVLIPLTGSGPDLM